MEAEANSEIPKGSVLLDLVNNTTEAITEAYKSPKSQSESRRDALMYALVQQAYFKHDATLANEEPTPGIPTPQDEENRWEQAIQAALKNDNWQNMKQAIQSDARTALGASAAVGKIADSGMSPKVGDEEEIDQTGTSLTNLAFSL